MIALKLKSAIVSISLFLVLNAQSQSEKWSISTFGGVAIPTGKFASKELGNNTSAFAKTGLSANISLRYKLLRNYGLSTLCKFQTNPVNTKALEDESLHYVPRSSYNITINSDDWKMAAIMIGGYCNFRINDKIYLDFDLMVGSLKTSVPQMTELNTEYEIVYSNGIIENDTTNTLITKSNNPLKWTFSWLAASSLKYKLSKKFFVLGRVDYSVAKPDVTRQPIPVVTSISTPSGTSVLSSGTILPIDQLTYKQPISTLNFSLGVEFSF